jgi:hypothetical protein
MSNDKVIIEEERLVIPTLSAFADSHDLGLDPVEDQDILCIPVIGKIGQAGVERAFCKLAHDLVSGVLVPDRCPMENGGMCRLAGYREPCLFTDFDHPLWQIIKESVALENDREVQLGRWYGDVPIMSNRIIAVLKRGPKSTSEIAVILNVSAKQVYNSLYRLQKKGWILKEDSHRTAIWKLSKECGFVG